MAGGGSVMAARSIFRRRARRPAGRHLRRDRRLIALCLATALGTGGALSWQLAVAAPPPEPVVEAMVPSLPDGVLDLTFGGDSMFGDGAAEKLAAVGFVPLLAGVRPLVAASDYLVINSETPFTAAAPPANRGAKYSYASDPAYLPALRDLGVDALNLGNNHAMDRGGAGLSDTLAAARSNEIATFGAGPTMAEASMPLLVRSSQHDVAVVSFGENFGAMHRSTQTTPGMLPLKPDRIERAIRVARDNGATKVVAFVHWGDNYDDVNYLQRYWAGVFADAGYDVVIGSGSHTLQAVEVVKGMPVAYGIGNFVFGAPGRFDTYGRPGLGAIANLRWEPGGTGVLTLRCIQTDNTLVDYVPTPCPPAQLAQARTTLGPAVAWPGGVGTLRF